MDLNHQPSDSRLTLCYWATLPYNFKLVCRPLAYTAAQILRRMSFLNDWNHKKRWVRFSRRLFSSLIYYQLSGHTYSAEERIWTADPPVRDCSLASRSNQLSYFRINNSSAWGCSTALASYVPVKHLHLLDDSLKVSLPLLFVAGNGFKPLSPNIEAWRSNR